ncbi:6256_t:CDS:2, partial [Entrophospora sp. SA101]
MSHDVGWAAIFHKGRTAVTERTPSLWLTPQKSALHPRYTTNIDMNRGIDGIFGNEILFNRWYHIAYILSNIEKRMDSRERPNNNVVTTGVLAGSTVGSFFC